MPNKNDNSYGRGIEIEMGIYDINGFQVRFFTKNEIRDLTTAEGFEILWRKEEYEEQVTLFSNSIANPYSFFWRRTYANYCRKH
jgi:hypothetical protein